MTFGTSIMALAAMVPAALNPSLTVKDKTLVAQLCGSATSITIKLGQPELPGTAPSLCCAKGCHGKRRGKSGGLQI